ncbi:hypothetical protein BJ508DRAFT_413671 [Ascobolus immersus RN42]|uniref:Uncharacterized protein n=1 Tax=Ascobolus immersus RN42 TaxID=1160509 RepID=A0A3N4IA91_ASCIM|nr:hypothetical protein BJ508DRAFT_413671 [Ascobolus immersus RN42]
MKFSIVLPVIAALSATSSALAIPTFSDVKGLFAIEKRETAIQATDRLLFSASLSTFTTAKSKKNPSTLDWSDDGCSKAPDSPLGFKFAPRCHRHDFGYRNYKKQKRMNETARKKIDDQFKKDLYAYCDTFSGLKSAQGVLCRRTADIYYAAVRAAGDGRIFNVKLP